MLEFKVIFDFKMNGIWQRNQEIFVKTDQDENKAKEILKKAYSNREELIINSIEKVK